MSLPSLLKVPESVTQASAAYHANTQGATRIQAKVRANGATTSRGWSEEIRR